MSNDEDNEFVLIKNKRWVATPNKIYFCFLKCHYYHYYYCYYFFFLLTCVKWICISVTCNQLSFLTFRFLSYWQTLFIESFALKWMGIIYFSIVNSSSLHFHQDRIKRQEWRIETASNPMSQIRNLNRI